MEKFKSLKLSTLLKEAPSSLPGANNTYSFREPSSLTSRAVKTPYCLKDVVNFDSLTSDLSILTYFITVMVLSDECVIETVEWYDKIGFVQPLKINKKGINANMSNNEEKQFFQDSDIIDPLIRV